jgi:hypothetical protein
MKHLRLRLTPDEETIHPLFSMVTGGKSITGARMVDWNVSNPDQPRLLFAVVGNRDAVSEELASMRAVDGFEITPVSEGQFYLHVWPEPTPVSRRLFEMYQREDLMLVHPVEYTDDSAYVSVLGESAVLQRAVDQFSSGLRVTVERVGGFHTTPETVVSLLSPRQREAMETAFEFGYYRHPREATHEDIAEWMDCAPNTVTAHLQKAEAKVVAAILE